MSDSSQVESIPKYVKKNLFIEVDLNVAAQILDALGMAACFAGDYNDEARVKLYAKIQRSIGRKINVRAQSHISSSRQALKSEKSQ